jgi:hypothetical protein
MMTFAEYQGWVEIERLIQLHALRRERHLSELIKVGLWPSPPASPHQNSRHYWQEIAKEMDNGNPKST